MKVTKIKSFESTYIGQTGQEYPVVVVGEYHGTPLCRIKWGKNPPPGYAEGQGSRIVKGYIKAFRKSES